MEFRDYLRVLRRHWRLIIALAVIGALVGAGAALLQPKRYTASARAYVSISGAQTLNDQVTGITFAEEAAQGYADIATSGYVLQPVIDRLRLPNTPSGLGKRLTVTVADNSPVIQVTVLDSSPRRAALTANAVVAQLSTAAIDLTPGDVSATPAPAASPATTTPSTSGSTTGSVKLTAVDLAPLAVVNRVGFSTALATAVGLLLGALVGAALGLFRDLLDTRIRTREDLDRLLDVPVLGATLRDPRVGRRPLVVLPGVNGPSAEAYRGLRTSLRFVQVDPARPSFVITSSVEGEGKSVTASNLALALAGVGSRVLLVDADLRRPRIAACFEVDGTIGLTDVLIGAVRLDETVQAFGSTGVDLLPAGSLPPNPNELLQSPAMRELLARLHREYDVVLFDSPPLLAVSDAVLLGEQAGAVIVVAASGRVRRQQLEAALESLQAVGARIAGVVLTMLPRKGPDGQQYAYGYGTDRSAPPRAAAGAVDGGETDRQAAVAVEPTPESASEHPVQDVLSAVSERVAAAARSGDDGGFLEIAAEDDEDEDLEATGRSDTDAEHDAHVADDADVEEDDAVVPKAEELVLPRPATEETSDQVTLPTDAGVPAFADNAEPVRMDDAAARVVPLPAEPVYRHLAIVDYFAEGGADDASDEEAPGALSQLVEPQTVDAGADSISEHLDEDAPASGPESTPRRARRFARASKRSSSDGAPSTSGEPAAAPRSSAKPVRIAPPPELAQRLRRQSDSRSA